MSVLSTSFKKEHIERTEDDCFYLNTKIKERCIVCGRLLYPGIEESFYEVVFVEETILVDDIYYIIHDTNENCKSIFNATPEAFLV